MAIRLAFGLLLVGLATACGAWQRQPPHEVPALADATASYLVVLETLRDQKYTIIDQDPATHTVRVRSHVDEHKANRVSIILLHVEGDKVYLSASGYLVRADGSTHHALNSELAELDSTLRKKLGAASQPAASAALAPSAGPPSSLPLAWSEPASDASKWGNGVFTCLPVQLADQEQTQLSLQLSNGEAADVMLSLAHAPELCRSKSKCKVADGCPALGIADAERVSRLAARLSKHEIGSLATLYSRGQPLVSIDLSKHGSIAQSMNEKP
ncbi:MAG TPA: hypothetical protein VFK05_35275 [Polyangiaceae bacterium]|nr:hypothetical protein [Polyangiaceae bacterium]